MKLVHIRSLLFVAVAATASLCLSPSAFAESYFWLEAGAGPSTWNNALSWNPNGVPNGSADTATFTALGTPAAQDITLDGLDGEDPGPITLAALNLNSTDTSYTIANGSGTGFTFAGAAPAINVGANAQAQAINADITNGGTGALLILHSTGAGLLTLGGTIDTNNLPLQINAVPNVNVTGVVSGGGSLQKRGAASTLTLSAPNTYSGGTYFGIANLGPINTGTIVLTGGDDRLLNTSTVFFHPPAYAATGTYTSTLDVGSTSQTLSTIHLPGADAPGTSQAPTGAAVTITGNGGTLKLNGDNLYIGIATNATYTGALTHNVNMSGLSNFIFDNSSKEVGVQLMGANRASGQVATLTMASNNTVTASNFLVGNTSPGGTTGGGSSTVTLGNGVNDLTIGSSASAGAINVGFGVRSSASLSMPAGGTVTIRGYNGGLSGGSNPLLDFNIGHIFNSADNRAFTDAVDFSAGTVDALITNMLIGLAGDALANVNRTGRTNASFTMGDGTVTVDTLTVGSMRLAAGTTVGIAGLTTATAGILRSNSAFIINHPNGVLNATTINLAENRDLGASLVDANDQAIVTGGLGLTDGTVRATTIQQPHTETSIATAIASISWTNGTLENTTGSNLTITEVPISLLVGSQTFNATGSNSITVEATSPITGAGFGINKTGTGTLTYKGANTYGGPTTVSEGTLLQNGSYTGGGSGDGFFVSDGATFGGSGTINTSAVVVNTGGTLAPGDGGGTLTVDGTAAVSPAVTLSSGAKLRFSLNSGLASSKLSLINGEFGDLSFADNMVDFVDLASGTLQAGDYTLFTSDVADAYAGLTVDGGNVITGGLFVGAGLSGYGSSLLKVSGNNIVLALGSGAGLPGDFNHDNKVDAADYVIWRKDPTNPANGYVSNPSDGYNLWRSHFGNPPGSGSGLEGGAAPEPAGLLLMAFAMGGAISSRWRR